MRVIHLSAAAAAIAVGAMATAVWAAAPQDKGKQARNTPPGWSYELKKGKRMPRVPRQTNADGSWTEQVRQGNCVIERTGRDGEIRERRECD